VVNQIGGKEGYFLAIFCGKSAGDGPAGRPPAGERSSDRANLQTGDTVDSWKVIIVEPEKQLTCYSA
jgi:hypothetical protein